MVCWLGSMESRISIVNQVRTSFFPKAHTNSIQSLPVWSIPNESYSNFWKLIHHPVSDMTFQVINSEVTSHSRHLNALNGRAIPFDKFQTFLYPEPSYMNYQWPIGFSITNTEEIS